MTNEEAVRKLEYSKTAYQMLIDEKVDSGKLVGKDVKGEWKADTPLDEAYKSMIEALEMGIKAIKALEQEPCEGAISRQAVLYGLASIAKAKAKSDAQKSLMGRVMFFVEQLPPVTPQPKTGHWIWCIGSHKCSNCEECTCFGHKELLKYCPNCGCRMVESQERSDKE